MSRLGAGVHFCVGAPLARLELETVFLPILFRRLPELALRGDAAISRHFHFHGLEALKVQWG